MAETHQVCSLFSVSRSLKNVLQATLDLCKVTNITRRGSTHEPCCTFHLASWHNETRRPPEWHCKFPTNYWEISRVIKNGIKHFLKKPQCVFALSKRIVVFKFTDLRQGWRSKPNAQPPICLSISQSSLRQPINSRYASLSSVLLIGCFGLLL